MPTPPPGEDLGAQVGFHCQPPHFTCSTLQQYPGTSISSSPPSRQATWRDINCLAQGHVMKPVES